ncbi:MAG: DNA-processing protein DprA, partial [Pseudomonadota bacterium]
GGLTDTEKFDWIRLARTPRVGPVTFFQLIAKFGSASDALSALPSLSSRSLKLHPISERDLNTELEKLSAYGARIVCSCEHEFPPLLTQFSPPPPILSVLGQSELVHKRCVAIVGARQASAAGRKLAKDIAADLSQAGFSIVSGLARGIDGEAHAASLETGTIAVLGGGIDHIYPPQHDRLYAEIAQKGLLVSERPFGHRATARDFPRRNRIITGIAEGVVIIEAAERSGSLISARTASEQNREVMTVPGSPLDPRSAGSNRLLRDGATLIRHADDVLEALSRSSTALLRAPPDAPYTAAIHTPEQIPASQIDAVRTALDLTPMPIAALAEAAGVSAARCAIILVELELAGIAKTYAGGLAALAI